MMRRGYDGTCPHLSADHLHRYVSKFAGRHNIRDMDTIDMMGSWPRGWPGNALHTPTWLVVIR